MRRAALMPRSTLAAESFGDPVAFEEPGYRLARQVLTDRGATLLPIPVDDDGLRVSDLPTGTAVPPLVYLTPSHQFPLGSRLSLPRRHAVIGWAAAHDSLLVEDDYDGEFRYDTTPLPALAALAPSAWPILAPSLKCYRRPCGWATWLSRGSCAIR